MAKHTHLKKTEKGQSLVELAISLLILLLVLAGVVDLGRLIFQYISIRDAAQEGAVYASIYPTACNQTIERVKSSLSNTDPNQVTVTVLINGLECGGATAQDACANKEARVTIQQPNYEISMPFLGSALGKQTIAISATMSSTIIRPPCN